MQLYQLCITQLLANFNQQYLLAAGRLTVKWSAALCF